MKKAIISTILFLITLQSNVANAIYVDCYEGPAFGMQNTAYVTISTDLVDYIYPGYFYAMAISTDLYANITGEYAHGFYKQPFYHVYGYVWLRAPHFDWRKILASGGLMPRSEDKCETKYVYIRP